MQILILIALGVFFSLDILLLVFYLKMKNKYIKTDSDLKNSEEKYDNLLKNYKYSKEELLPKRCGIYKETVSLVDNADRKKGISGDPYSAIIYVQELDRYTNGTCKIKLLDIEVTSGYDSNQYYWVKGCFQKRFVSLKKQGDIEWLESEESIKELRKQKLEKLGKIE
jgi:hypothetical protein